MVTPRSPRALCSCEDSRRTAAFMVDSSTSVVPPFGGSFSPQRLAAANPRLPLSAGWTPIEVSWWLASLTAEIGTGFPELAWPAVENQMFQSAANFGLATSNGFSIGDR